MVLCCSVVDYVLFCRCSGKRWLGPLPLTHPSLSHHSHLITPSPQQHRADLQRRRPLVLEDVEADAPELVDVGVVDLGQEAHLGRRHGVVLGQEELELEGAALC